MKKFNKWFSWRQQTQFRQTQSSFFAHTLVLFGQIIDNYKQKLKKFYIFFNQNVFPNAQKAVLADFLRNFGLKFKKVTINVSLKIYGFLSKKVLFAHNSWVFRETIGNPVEKEKILKIFEPKCRLEIDRKGTFVKVANKFLVQSLKILQTIRNFYSFFTKEKPIASKKLPWTRCMQFCRRFVKMSSPNVREKLDT